MATNANAVTQQSKATYKSFCVCMTTSTVAVIVILGLMAIFLL